MPLKIDSQQHGRISSLSGDVYVRVVGRKFDFRPSGNIRAKMASAAAPGGSGRGGKGENKKHLYLHASLSSAAMLNKHLPS